MKRIDWKILFGIALIALSASFYFIDYLILKNFDNLIVSLMGNLAFVFIQVLLVTLVLEQFLQYREKKALLAKLNMVIGTFFSEVGTDLLKRYSSFDKDSSEIANELVITKNWTEREFSRVRRITKNHHFNIDSQAGDLNSLKSFLKDKRLFLLRLLENPNLLEHESFTNLLWAVFHLTEELLARKSLKDLPEADYKHLAEDIKRVYNLLIVEWLFYMAHLKDKYPYLFSLAMRTNPFDAAASVEIR